MDATLQQNGYVEEILDRLNYPAWVSKPSGEKTLINKLAKRIIKDNTSIDDICANGGSNIVSFSGKTFRYGQIPLNHNSGLILHELVLQDDTTTRIKAVAAKIADIRNKKSQQQ